MDKEICSYPTRISKETVSETNTEYAKKIVFEAYSTRKQIYEAAYFIRNNMTIADYPQYTNRLDLCMPSMAGCNLGCTFCATTGSKEGFQGNLSHEHMTEAIEYVLRDAKKRIREKTMILITFMGNGDPVVNMENVIETIRNVHDTDPARVTRFGLSTIGKHSKNIEKAAQFSSDRNIPIWLQYSLISMDPIKRKSIIPNAPTLEKVVADLDNYATITKSPTRYNIPAMQETDNLSKEHLEELADFINESPATRMVKLSSYNEIEGKNFTPYSAEEMESAAQFLRDHKVKVDVFVANQDKNLKGGCGQLRG